MSRRPPAHDLAVELDQSGSSAAQIFLAQRVLTAISRSSSYSDHISTAATMAAELPRFCAAVQTWTADEQPHPPLLAHLCRSAYRAVDQAIGQWGTAAAPLATVKQELDQAANALKVLKSSSSSTSNKQTARASLISAAARMRNKIPAVRRLLEVKFVHHWDHAPSTLSAQVFADLHLSANELAFLVSQSDRDANTLHDDLARAIRSHGSPDGHTAVTLMLPPESRYRAALVVRGTSVLRQLEKLEPTAAVSRLDQLALHGFEYATGDLATFIAQTRATGSACVVSIDVEAVDHASAGLRARRRVSELLDQYMAGHRLVDLATEADVVVRAAGEVAAKHVEAQRVTRSIAIPLTHNWPARLRNALRLAHVARTTSSPMPAAALAWSALEACGLKDVKEPLARALSLQAMRQQLVDLHSQLSRAVRAAQHSTQQSSRTADSIAAGLTWAVEACGPGRAAHQDLLVRAENATKVFEAANSRRLIVEALVADQVLDVERHVQLAEGGRLGDVNAWKDLLLPATSRDDVQTTTARNSLNKIISTIRDSSVGQIALWRERLANPDLCADWLVDREHRTFALLNALYSTRNQALHAGEFRSQDDLNLAEGGSLLVDFTLEVIGNWYRNAAAQQQHMAPVDAVRALATRAEHLVEDLRNGATTLHELDLALLTSPTPSGRWPRQDGR